MMQALENLTVVTDGDGNATYQCARCGTGLGPTTEDYKRGCVYRERPVAEIGRLFDDPRRFVDDDIVFREFLCPSCGGLFDTEVNRKTEPPVHDIHIRL
jgi:acetone carboxylase gamma subunit